MKIEAWVVYSALAAVAWLFFSMRKLHKLEMQKFKSQISEINAERLLAINEKTLAEKSAMSANRAMIDAVEQKDRAEKFAFEKLDTLKKESALLPSVVSLLEDIESRLDFSQVMHLRTKKRPALAAADYLKEAKSELREFKSKCRMMENQISLYEANAPWLRLLLDYSLEEINSGLALAAAEQNGSSDDRTRLYVSDAEWVGLSSQERSQLALDRYFESRHKNAWLAGIAYERFIGSWYENDGFHVTYNGAISGKEDQGIDLVCVSGKLVVLVQCKRLSAAKEIPVRENAVAQIYGAALFYAHKHGIEKSSVVPTIVTSYKLSNEAKEFAGALDVHFVEYELFRKYAAIKCNVGRGKERIYHLPFDQQYDKIHINKSLGDCYVATVKEAEALGFRRAYKWSGS